MSETSGPIVIKFYLNHHLCGRSTILSFGLDWIKTLVSMATGTCSSNNFIMKNCCGHISTFILIRASFLQETRPTIKSQMSSKLGQIRPRAAELAALERLQKSPYTYNGSNVVANLAPSF